MRTIRRLSLLLVAALLFGCKSTPPRSQASDSGSKRLRGEADSQPPTRPQWWRRGFTFGQQHGSNVEFTHEQPVNYAMKKTVVTSPELAPPVGPFSQAIEVGGFLYFSGQVGQDPATGKVVEGGIVAETERVFQNLSAVLKAAGKSFDDVVRAGVYLTSMSDFVAMNGIYAKYFSQPFPARTTIAVAALPLGACVEIDLVVKA